ncbi:cellulose binding domain-containing protein [Catellatospora methionotrophica]|uniref:cellulose binding domain-containing protein n=1 Tax=Catellatospora methionotrophica TaxID=121620 RepID=UPI0033C37A1E
MFRLQSDTGTRFAATVTVTNAATGARTPARISFDLPGDQRIAADPRWQQQARTVTATGSRTLDPGAELSLPVTGTYRDANPLPTAFRLDGRPCAATLLGPSGATITPQPVTPVASKATTGPDARTPAPRPSPDAEPEPEPVPPSPDSSPSSEPSPAAPSPSPVEGEA